MKCTGVIASDDWKLYMHARETGVDFLVCWGSEQDAREKLRTETAFGSDVWLISPIGEKVLPK